MKKMNITRVTKLMLFSMLVPTQCNLCYRAVNPKLLCCSASDLMPLMLVYCSHDTMHAVDWDRKNVTGFARSCC